MAVSVQCPFCFEVFSIQLFAEDGATQEITYDCEVCCHPIDILATWREDEQVFKLDIQRSGGF